ncbi:acyltransferase family protein [Singulisphaera acidiphila]|uniref:Putative acyltransferase n=1 Tax=Singulisphaera acidiphila (strain ATCC BAA-1392 / DSM 18658 / VKM B-2454 / MOB10) TaxID=886293 RepID=L0DL93_SINAD|nr:acyltransferase family protein [Singulisphaera acidiphila]AGA29618.1 putative acyltransferase [Singulisphaera acidiphila DSM 18658]
MNNENPWPAGCAELIFVHRQNRPRGAKALNRVTQADNVSRFHHLDALRGLLMALGVVLHAANIYTPQGRWLVADSQRGDFFGVLTAVIHSFRLPCFFMISGLLSIIVLERKGVDHFLRSRTIRLAVPCLSAMVLLNSAQTWLLAWHGQRPFVDYLSEAGWLSHLWFLVDLLIYCYVLAMLRPLLLRFPQPSIFAGTVVLMMPIVTQAFAVGMGRAVGYRLLFWGLLDAHRLATYALFFAFGAIYRPGSDEVRDRQLVVWSIVLLIIAIIAKVSTSLPLLTLYADASLSWAGALICLQTGKRFIDRPNHFLRRLADASYTIYLFHHVIVIGLGIALLGLPITAWTKFLAIVLLTFILTFGIHRFVIAPFPLLGFLFNGRLRVGKQSFPSITPSPIE